MILAILVITGLILFSLIVLFFFISYQTLTVLNRLETVAKLMEQTVKMADATIQSHSRLTQMLNE